MAKWTELTKKKIQDMAEETAKGAVGKSVPSILHEPKVPACLKKTTKAED